MPKVHPNANALQKNAAVEREKPTNEEEALQKNAAVEREKPTIEEEIVLTVWRKSLLFNGNGFTVFDGKGNLEFRVDNYASEHKGEIVLMDAAGKPLRTVRRKKLSFGDRWLIYDGEDSTNPIFSVKKHVNLRRSKSLAHINHCNNSSESAGSRSSSPCSSPKSPFTISGGGGGGGGSSSVSPCSSPKSSSTPAFEVEGSYAQRCCTIFDDSHRQIAEIKRKESNNGGVAFGLDVFKLIVQPGFDASVAMAVVILLEQMFGSKGSSSLIKG